MSTAGGFVKEHPWMTFFLASSAIGAVAAVMKGSSAPAPGPTTPYYSPGQDPASLAAKLAYRIANPNAPVMIGGYDGYDGYDGYGNECVPAPTRTNPNAMDCGSPYGLPNIILPNINYDPKTGLTIGTGQQQQVSALDQFTTWIKANPLIALGGAALVIYAVKK